jgi:hypothetical protein
MAASIYGSQTLPTPQSLAAYLQALQAKTNNPTGNPAGLDGSIANGDVGSVAGGTGKSSNGKTSTDPTGTSPLDVVTLSAEAQRLLANAQTPSAGPGSLATYLNTSNTTDTTSGNPFGISDIGAIAQFRQWLSQPLGQPVPYPGDQAATKGTPDESTPGDQASATTPVSSTSS